MIILCACVRDQRETGTHRQHGVGGPIEVDSRGWIREF